MLTFIFRTDYVLVQDKSFKKFAKAYADSQELWFKEYAFYHFESILNTNLSLPLHSFSKAVSRLFELGVPTEQFVTSEPWILPTVGEQKDAKKD